MMTTTRTLRRCKNIFRLISLSGLVGLVAWHAPATGQQPEIVLVAGRAVEVIRMGSGSPTVVLESGGSLGAASWQGVIAELARLPRVIAYSRAGLGNSAPAPGPASPQASVARLRELLHAIGETEPVILAGHSWGGLLARLYVSTFPANVAGLVLIDATHEAQYARWEPLVPGFSIADTIRAFARQLPAAEQARWAETLAVQAAQRVEGMQPLPDALPLAVITALKPCPPEREFICRDPRALAIWRDLHHEWFTQTATGMHIVSDQTGHMVMNDQPELIVQAVSFVLEHARASRRP